MPDTAHRSGATCSVGCQRCPRLSAFLDEVRTQHPDYHAQPVESFGPVKPRLLIVGLAPGMHGANATGRPFTGDYAGVLLYRTLYAFGWASQPEGVTADDGMVLHGCRITNAVRCLPPANRPTGAEVAACRPYLAAELAALQPPRTVLALGRLAHDAVLRALGVRLRDAPFSHGSTHRLGEGVRLVSSYHCSRYNTQTGRLTEPMFRSVFETIESDFQTPDGP